MAVEREQQGVQGGWRAWALATLFVWLVLGAVCHEALGGSRAIDAAALLPYEDMAYAPDGPYPPTAQIFDPSPETMFTPWDVWMQRTARAGELPSWQPGNGFGSPVLETGQALPFHPLKWLWLWWGGVSPLSMAWFLVSKLAIAALGVLLLARSLGLSPTAGAFGALAFALCGTLTFQLHYFDDALMLPWLLFAGERLLRRPDTRAVAFLGVGIGLAAFVEHPETALYVAFTAVLATAIGAWAGAGRWGTLARLAGAVALGALVAAVAALPFIAQVGQSQSYLFEPSGPLAVESRRNWWIVPALVSAFMHLFSGTADPQVHRFNSWSGIVPVALAAMGLWRGTPVRRIVFTLLGVTAGALLLAHPSRVVGLLPSLLKSYYVMPMLSLAIGLAGAATLDLLAADAGLRRRAATFLAGAAGVALLFQVFGPAPSLPYWGAAGDFRLQIAVAAAAALVLYLGSDVAWPGRRVALSLLVLAALDLGLSARLAVPPMPPFRFPVTKAIAFLQQHPEARVVGFGQALFPNTHLVYGLSSLESVDAFHSPRYAAYMQAVALEPAPLIPIVVVPFLYTPELLDLANVRYLVTVRGTEAGDRLEAAFKRDPERYRQAFEDGRLVIYESVHAQPRAWVAYAADYVPAGVEAAAERLKATPARWRDRVLLEGTAPAGWQDAPLPAGEARLVARTASSLTLEASPSRPGWLVVSEGADAGWRAAVDGAPAAIAHADVGFRAVYLTAGAHRVVFKYTSPVLAASAWVSAGALLFGLLLLAAPRRSPHPP